MFNEILSSIKDTVIGVGRNTLNQYRPSTLMAPDGAFERVAQQGIANMSYRSPVMADIAQTMMYNLQAQFAQKAEIGKFLKSESSTGFREHISEKLGANAPESKINAEMGSILSKITKSIDKNGIEETKKSAVFREYEKYFNEFKNKNKPTDNTRTGDTVEPNNGMGGDYSQVLAKIESNTSRIAQAVHELARIGITGHKGGHGDDEDGHHYHGAPLFNPKGAGGTYIDPYTGLPSIRAAVGHIGGSFLSKVIDDETIDRFANKTKKYFGLGGDTEAKPVHRAPKNSDINPLTGHPNVIIPEYVRPKPKENDKPKTSITQTLKNKAVEKYAPVLKERLPDIVKSLPSKATGLAETTGTIVEGAGTAARLAGAGAAVAETGGALAGAAGAVGTGAAVLEGGGALAALGAGAVAAAPWLAGAAVIGGLGYGAYKLFGSEDGDNPSVVPATKESVSSVLPDRTNLAPKQAMVASNINALTEAKSKQSVAETDKMTQPIVINNNTNAGSPQSAPPVMIGGTSVRNTESTFERVQMQDFWSRTA